MSVLAHIQILYALIIVGVSIIVVQAISDPPTVLTKYGILQGSYDGLSREGRRFYQFRGIQYAVISERFKPSVPPAPWSGTKLAVKFGPTCVFLGESSEERFSENCLYLNLYTTSLSGYTNGTLFPVVVYLHGGAFKYNSGQNYGPNYLMDENIIFVTINFRLGILGFLSTEDAESPGNWGLKDQIMALTWVTDNIHAFGGDKDRVTLMGQSSGGTSVSLHLVSPMSAGLFQNAIVQSGNFLIPSGFVRKPLRYAKRLAEFLECNNTKDTKAIVRCLRKVPVEILGNPKIAENATVTFFKDPIIAFGPVIEPKLEHVEAFLTENPLRLLKAGKVHKVPLLTGVVKEEGVYLWAAYLLLLNTMYAIHERERLQANFTGLAPYAFLFNEQAPVSHRDEISHAIEKFYFGKVGGFLLNNSQTLHRLALLYTDRKFLEASVKFINLYSQLAPTYPYLYTYSKYVGLEFGEEEWHKRYHFGATHAAELDMMISPLFGKVRKDKPDFDKVSKPITKLWASFVKNGVPTATYGSASYFPPVDARVGLQQWYQLDSDTKLINNSIFSDRIAFWNSLSSLGLNDDDFDSCYC